MSQPSAGLLDRVSAHHRQFDGATTVGALPVGAAGVAYRDSLRTADSGPSGLPSGVWVRVLRPEHSSAPSLLDDQVLVRRIAVNIWQVGGARYTV